MQSALSGLLFAMVLGVAACSSGDDGNSGETSDEVSDTNDSMAPNGDADDEGTSSGDVGSDGQTGGDDPTGASQGTNDGQTSDDGESVVGPAELPVDEGTDGDAPPGSEPPSGEGPDPEAEDPDLDVKPLPRDDEPTDGETVEATIGLSCASDADCVLCAYNVLPAKPCACAPLCVFEPMNEASCKTFTQAWSTDECKEAQVLCPVAACLAPDPFACVDGQCRSVPGGSLL